MFIESIDSFSSPDPRNNYILAVRNVLVRAAVDQFMEDFDKIYASESIHI